MKKKIILSLVLAVLMLFSVAGAAFAGDSDVSVELSDIQVEQPGSSWVVGSILTVSGTVTVTSTSSVNGFLAVSESDSTAWFAVNDAGGVINQDSNTKFDLDAGFFNASTDASQTYNWSCDVIVPVGGLIISQGGYGQSWAAALFGGTSLSTDSNQTSLSISTYQQPEWFDNGGFEVAIGDLSYHQSYGFSDGVLTEDVDLFGYSNGKPIRVTIPEGTVISGTDRLYITYDPYGNPFIGYDFQNLHGEIIVQLPDNATFSNPVTVIYDYSSGTQPGLSFTQVVDNQPQ